MLGNGMLVVILFMFILVDGVMGYLLGGGVLGMGVVLGVWGEVVGLMLMIGLFVFLGILMMVVGVIGVLVGILVLVMYWMGGNDL